MHLQKETAEDDGAAGERAAALGAAYGLIGAVLLRGVTAELQPLAAQVPAWRGLLDDLETMAATHYDVFGQNVYPYATTFLSSEQLLGGRLTEQARAFFMRVGFAPDESSAADHLGQLVGCLGFLCDAEADAIADGAVFDVLRLQGLQRNLMSDLLLPWLPPLWVALGQHDDGIYRMVVRTLLLLLDEQGQSLGDVHSVDTFELPSMPDLLGDDKTGLKDIAAVLVNTPVSGWYLSRSTITGFGRKFALPLGFGDRRQKLTNLLRSAVVYDKLTDLLSAIGEAALAFGQSVADDCREFEVLRPHAAVWARQPDATKALMLAMTEAAARFRDEPAPH